uniref:Putative secreted peptide n=1 Tax=Anopheles braziliensis TaxID=58242 RepID=A0A2M3ZSP2_9DIPT
MFSLSFVQSVVSLVVGTGGMAASSLSTNSFRSVVAWSCFVVDLSRMTVHFGVPLYCSFGKRRFARSSFTPNEPSTASSAVLLSSFRNPSFFDARCSASG